MKDRGYYMLMGFFYEMFTNDERSHSFEEIQNKSLWQLTSEFGLNPIKDIKVI